MNPYTLLLAIAVLTMGTIRVPAQSLTLKAESTTGEAGSERCLEISATDFQNIIAMQYTLAWDPEKLKFTGVKAFQLPYLSEHNFGAHRIEEGILTFVWLDNSLNGVTLADYSSAFQLCFEVKGQPGETATVGFTQHPTPFEAVDASERLLSIEAVDGIVRIE